MRRNCAAEYSQSKTGTARARARRSSEQDLRLAKQTGFSDAEIAGFTGSTEAEVRAARIAAGVIPVYKSVDTCAAEFEAETPYFYSCYDQESEATRSGARKGHHPGQRPQPHRPGHRVRLLLRATRS